MYKEKGILTIFFEDPFWVGIFECIDDRGLTVCKVTFGAEPKDYEILAFIQKSYYKLKFSPSVEAETKEKAVSPKRRQREAKQQLAERGIGTKAQQALKLQQEQNKLERKSKSREQKLVEEERRFELRQLKKHEKRRGH